MTKLRLFIVACFLGILSIPIFQLLPSICLFCRAESGTLCTVEDYQYANFWNYYDPDDAYEFGLKIQKIFEDRDSDELLKIMDEELASGPRRSVIANNKFEEVFSANLVEEILANQAPCSPIGWRGFTIGNGLIWFNVDENGFWRIFSINGVVDENNINPNPYWRVNRKIVHPVCFVKPLISGDNFEEIADVNNIVELSILFEKPGLLYGDKISQFNEFLPSWCSNGQNCNKISIAKKINNCPEVKQFNYDQVKVWQFQSTKTQLNGIYQKRFEQDVEEEFYYSVLMDLDLDVCQFLAPNFNHKCEKLSLIEVGDYAGGSFGWHFSYGIYGLYDLPEQGRTILPLMFFPTKNHALNFVEPYK